MTQQPFEKIFNIEKCRPEFLDIEMSLEEQGLTHLWMQRWVEAHPDHALVKNLKIMYTYDDLFDLFLDGAMTGIAYSGEVLHRRAWDK